MSRMNRLANISNRFQGRFKKVLCVCSAGLLRSPTAAFVLSQDPYNYNTRAVGTETEFALTPIDDVMLTWADEIVCMESHHAEDVEAMLKINRIHGKKIVILDIKDEYAYRDQALIDQIRINYDHAMLMEKLTKPAEKTDLTKT